MKYREIDGIKALEMPTTLPQNNEVTSFDTAVCRYCSNCGTYYYAVWAVPAVRDKNGYSFVRDENLEKKARREQGMFENANCLICEAAADKSGFSLLGSNPNSRRGGQYLDINRWNFFFRAKDRVKDKTCDDRQISESKVKQLMEEYTPASSFVQNDHVEQIKASSEKLKEYLSKMIVLELNSYTLPKILQDLYYERMQLTKKCNYEKGIRCLEYRENVISAKEKLEGAKTQTIEVSYPEEPLPPELKKPGIFNKSKVLAENKLLQEQYKSAMERYQQQVADCHKEEDRLRNLAISEATEKLQIAEAALAAIQAKSSEGQTPAEAFASSLDERICEIEDCLKETLKTRSDLYAFGVVFGKYRDLVAISTFYEYLMAGRCTTLEGADGAYNIYENEIRANLIISKLTDIIKKLDQIQANQYMLYTELRTANEQLKSLNSKMKTVIQTLDKIEDTTAQIAYNTEMAAFYSKKNAELTDALGFMMALK